MDEFQEEPRSPLAKGEHPINRLGIGTDRLTACRQTSPPPGMH